MNMRLISFKIALINLKKDCRKEAGCFASCWFEDLDGDPFVA